MHASLARFHIENERTASAASVRARGAAQRLACIHTPNAKLLAEASDNNTHALIQAIDTGNVLPEMITFGWIRSLTWRVLWFVFT
jgi:hypothetical protein